MLIAVSSEKPSLEGLIDQRFGRCVYFLVINPDDLSFEAIRNQSAQQTGGAGIQAAQMIAGKGVTHVFTGTCGPNAFQVLAAAGIQVVTGCTGNIREVIEQYREGRFSAATGPGVGEYAGLDRNPSGPAGPKINTAGRLVPGMGGGAGMRGGGGRGMCTGRGTGMGRWTGREINVPEGFLDQRGPATVKAEETVQEELESLKRQMLQITARIRELEKGRTG